MCLKGRGPRILEQNAMGCGNIFFLSRREIGGSGGRLQNGADFSLAQPFLCGEKQVVLDAQF